MATNPTQSQAPPQKQSYHPNFLGIPTKEDIQTLEQLRRQLMPMIGLLDKLQVDMTFALNRGDAVNWPHIRHNISVINSYLTSINGYMNGSYRHAEETIKDSKGNKQVVYRDSPNEGQAERIGALHVYPQAPFPMGDERFAAMAAVLLEKRLGGAGMEEKWIEARLRKAADFAHVPGEWDIEARKKEDEEESDDEDVDGWDATLPTKRVKGMLNEDEILDMWANGHKTAFNKEFQSQMGGEETGSDEDMEEGDEEEQEEEEEIGKALPPPPVVMIQRAAPAVHKAVPGVPMMALGMVHRFMISGEVQQPAGGPR